MLEMVEDFSSISLSVIGEALIRWRRSGATKIERKIRNDSILMLSYSYKAIMSSEIVHSVLLALSLSWFGYLL